MKRFEKQYKNLLALLAIVLMVVGLVNLGAINLPGAIFIVGCWQLLQFAMSKRCGACFNSVLTPEQVKEFEKLLDGFKGYDGMFKELADLAKAVGGWAAIKQLPELLKAEQGRVDSQAAEIKKLNKRLLSAGTDEKVRWIGKQPFVTNDCARALTAVFVLDVARLRGNAMDQLVRDPGMRSRVIDISAEVLGYENAQKAMTATEIPLPTVYVPQVIELVWMWGQARQYATVFPLGAGVVKLPRLKAGEDDFGYMGAGTAGMSQAVGEKKVAAELVTFTANKAGGLIRLPTELEEDTFIPIGQFLARYIARQLAKLEDNTLFLGDGTATYAGQTGIGAYCVANNAYLLQLAAAKTKPSDVTLDDFRNVRSKVAPAILAGGFDAAYYINPTFEPMLRGFNKYPNFIVFENQNGQAKFDGWPVRWIGSAQAYGTVAAASKFITFFGCLPYWYLGERGAPRVEVSREVYFASDELAMRALERIDVECMGVDAMATIQTAAQ